SRFIDASVEGTSQVAILGTLATGTDIGLGKPIRKLIQQASFHLIQGEGRSRHSFSCSFSQFLSEFFNIHFHYPFIPD
ncbi:hypothetical protein KQ940_18875, partial [Marinobacterium sp. D7]|uniref:hypothetical protein n=1 Tax=Marinobacterium ramblicola TaxID=2849041 RepID=UPI001C2DC7EE